MANKPLVEAKSIFFEKGGRRIFSSLTMVLNEHDIVIVKGKNGSGKTSFLKCLAGYYSIKKGDILWNGEKIFPVQEPEKIMLAWLGHHNALKPSLTVKENLKFYADLWSTSQSDFYSSINYLSFSNYLEFPVSWLSAGEKRRLCLIRLMLNPAKVWFLDEPTTFLDVENKKIFEDVISKHVSNGGAVVCATHEELKVKNYKTLNLD